VVNAIDWRSDDVDRGSRTDDFRCRQGEGHYCLRGSVAPSDVRLLSWDEGAVDDRNTGDEDGDEGGDAAEIHLCSLSDYGVEHVERWGEGAETMNI
jgi:hypothetical protein